MSGEGEEALTPSMARTRGAETGMRADIRTREDGNGVMGVWSARSAAAKEYMEVSMCRSTVPGRIRLSVSLSSPNKALPTE